VIATSSAQAAWRAKLASGERRRHGTGVGTVRKWELGTRRPSGAARTLIEVIKTEPKAVRRALKSQMARDMIGRATRAKARSRAPPQNPHAPVPPAPAAVLSPSCAALPRPATLRGTISETSASGCSPA
jgi:hypothetical protein